jgi:hypothetical protein
VVEIAGKKITVNEQKIKDLEAMVDKLGGNLEELWNASDFNQGKNALFTVLYSKVTEIFPEVTEKDVQEAYPSELEALVGAFVSVNFSGVKKLAGTLMTAVSAQQNFKPSSPTTATSTGQKQS